jgi:hypothetical protein
MPRCCSTRSRSSRGDGGFFKANAVSDVDAERDRATLAGVFVCVFTNNVLLLERSEKA